MKQEQPTIEGLKFCKKCGKYKPISEFYRNASLKDNHENQCKECKIKYSRKRYAKTRSKKCTYYASHKDKMREYSMTQYYSTDYLEKKYLKRYQASLEKALAKKAHLEDSDTWKENPSSHMKQRMKKYESAIEKWKAKIREAEELIAIYAENKAKVVEGEKIEPAPLLESIKKTDYPTGEANEPKEETPKEEQTMTKEQLIALLAEVPDNAQIIYVGDTDSRSSLVAAWRPEPNTVCIRNLTQEMPYVITEGALYNMVSASMQFTNKGYNIQTIVYQKGVRTMRANELNKSEENGYYIDWLLNHFMFGYVERPKGDDTLFEINEKWVFADKNTARLYCDKLNEAMIKSGRMQETLLIKDIERGTRVYVPGWSTEEGYFQPLKAFFEPLVQHMFQQVFLTEEHCRNYCNHLNKFVKEVEPK